MEQDCVLARTHILWKWTVIICVLLITTMEWCNPLRLASEPIIVCCHFVLLCDLPFCFLWKFPVKRYTVSPKVSTDILFISCVGIKHKECFQGIFTLRNWGKSLKSQREYCFWCNVYHSFRQPSQDEMAWNEKLSFWPHVASIWVLQVADSRSLATVLVQWSSVARPTTRNSLQWNISCSVGERLSGNILEQILSFFLFFFILSGSVQSAWQDLTV